MRSVRSAGANRRSGIDRRPIALATIGVLAGSLAATPATATDPPTSLGIEFVGSDAIGMTRVNVGVLNSYLNSLRDGIQRATSSGGPIGFAAEDDGFGPRVLGYSARGKRSKRHPLENVYAKAHPMTSTPIRYSVWGQVFGDSERRSGDFQGVDIGRRILARGVLGGIDAIIPGVGSPGAFLVLGVLGNTMRSVTSNNDNSKSDMDGSGFGLYSAYIVGPYSVDASYKVDFIDIARRVPGAAVQDLGMTSHVVSLNLNYKTPLSGAWWVEPSIGFSHASSIWNGASSAAGLQDGTEVRVQGGARFGTSWQNAGQTFEPTLGVFVYSPVSISGGSTNAQPPAPTDEGDVFGQFTAKLNVIWPSQISAYVEGEARVGDNMSAGGLRVGARYPLNP